jgi:hypothetical protein
MNYENNVELVKAELIIAQNALWNAIDAIKEIQKTELDVLEYTGTFDSPQYENLKTSSPFSKRTKIYRKRRVQIQRVQLL